MEEPDHDKLTAILTRDPVVTIMFGIALVIIVLDLTFTGVAARTHHIEILKIPMLLTGAFAIAGIVLGLVRSLRSRRAN
jgi:hypothetical protein